jgi:2-dehydropantoate 2-reductase
MRIAILGSGAVGGYYGAKLARQGHDVVFLARGAHLRAMRERGLLVWSPLGDFLVRARAEDDAAQVGVVDLVLLGVKTYDNASALVMLPPLVGPQTIVLTLQNGVQSAERLAEEVGETRVLGGSTYIAAALLAPGLIEQTGTYRRIVFGEWFGDRSATTDRVQHLHAMFEAADIQSEPHADVRTPVWEKFIYLAPLAGFTAAARRPAGGVWGDPFIRGLFMDAVREVERVARASGIAVSDTILDRVTSYMDAVPPGMRSSLLIDLTAGKRLEVDALQGDVVRRGAALGVPTPIMSTLYAVLKPHAEGASL